MEQNLKVDKPKYAIITAIYQDKIYKSIPLFLEDNSDILQLILNLSESGTNKLNLCKLPTTINKFVLLSRKQLDETLFEVELLQDLPKSNKPIKTKKSKIIKS